jgi:hypothetical protein
MSAYPARPSAVRVGELSAGSGNGDNTMRRICPLDGEAYPDGHDGHGEPTGWELHIRWHITELDVESDMYGDLDPSALDVDAFIDRGVIRPYASQDW